MRAFCFFTKTIRPTTLPRRTSAPSTSLRHHGTAMTDQPPISSFPATAIPWPGGRRRSGVSIRTAGRASGARGDVRIRGPATTTPAAARTPSTAEHMAFREIRRRAGAAKHRCQAGVWSDARGANAIRTTSSSGCARRKSATPSGGWPNTGLERAGRNQAAVRRQRPLRQARTHPRMRPIRDGSVMVRSAKTNDNTPAARPVDGDATWRPRTFAGPESGRDECRDQHRPREILLALRSRRNIVHHGHEPRTRTSLRRAHRVYGKAGRRLSVDRRAARRTTALSARRWRS